MCRARAPALLYIIVLNNIITCVLRIYSRRWVGNTLVPISLTTIKILRTSDCNLRRSEIIIIKTINAAASVFDVSKTMYVDVILLLLWSRRRSTRRRVAGFSSQTVDRTKPTHILMYNILCVVLRTGWSPVMLLNPKH